MPVRLPQRAVGVCCKSSVTDLKSGFQPINIEQSKARTLPLLLFFSPCKCVGHNPTFMFHYGWILYAACPSQSEQRRTVTVGLRKTLKIRGFFSLLFFIRNDVGRDGYRREGKRDRRKLEAAAANTRQDGLLGETR